MRIMIFDLVEDLVMSPSFWWWKYPTRNLKQVLCVLFYALDKFVYGGKLMGYIYGTYVDNLLGVGDGLVSVISGYLSLCELRATHFQDSVPR